jgi:hypothetical protein
MRHHRPLDAGPTSVSGDESQLGNAPTEDQNTAVETSTSQTAECVDDASTSPDPLDVERLILSLDRAPRPPAPIPDERPSSDGGRFVAYRASGLPAQSQIDEDRRRQAIGELSVLVNLTPVPPEVTKREAPTAPASAGVRRRSLGLWVAGVVVIGLGVVASWAVQPGPAVVTGPAATAAGLVASAVSDEGVAAPTVRIQAPLPPEKGEVAAPLSKQPTQQPRAATPRAATTSVTSALIEPSSTAPSRPAKPAFGTW